MTTQIRPMRARILPLDPLSCFNESFFVGGGVKLPLALVELGSIDDYEIVVHPTIAGHGPTLFAGVSKPIDLKLVSELKFASGVVARRYEPRT